jgi:hypothetical protein
VKDAKHGFDQEACNQLHNDLDGKDSVHFWKSWQNLHGKNHDTATRINGKVRSEDICNNFAGSFKNIYTTGNSEQSRCLESEFDILFCQYKAEHIHDKIAPYLISWNEMLEVVSKLKTGKSSSSFIKAEHILNGSPKLIVHLHILFNGLLQHGYVPSDFWKGVVSPIIKDTEGDASSMDNYRGGHVFSFCLNMHS